jgi:hypothetical protein
MRNRLRTLALSVPLVTIFLAASAQGGDSCQPVFDALTKVATTPSHSYTTNTGVNGGTPAEAETIFANGQKYIRARGKWMRIPVTSQEVVEEEKEKQQHGTSTCQFLRNESVNGDTAMLFSVQREYEEVKEDGKMWVSRGTGLLLRVEEDVDNRGNKVKEHRSTRFEYENVQAPI